MTRAEGIREWQRWLQRMELSALLSELEECAGRAESLEAIQSYREDWFEAASSLRELWAVRLFPSVPAVFAERRRQLLGGLPQWVDTWTALLCGR